MKLEPSFVHNAIGLSLHLKQQAIPVVIQIAFLTKKSYYMIPNNLYFSLKLHIHSESIKGRENKNKDAH